MAGKQSAAMDKAEKLYRRGNTDVYALAKKAGLHYTSIYRAAWYKEAKKTEAANAQSSN